MRARGLFDSCPMSDICVVNALDVFNRCALRPQFAPRCSSHVSSMRVPPTAPHSMRIVSIDAAMIVFMCVIHTIPHTMLGHCSCDARCRCVLAQFWSSHTPLDQFMRVRTAVLGAILGEDYSIHGYASNAYLTRCRRSFYDILTNKFV